MLQDYEIKKTKTKMELVIPYIEFILMLIIIQSVLLLLAGGSEEEEAIRFRLLAHSNAPADQQIKMKIQQEIEPLLQNAVATSQSHDELEANLVALEETIIGIAQIQANGLPVKVERKLALFPPKRAGFSIHPQSAYDAYIVTIGSGRGDNWWCAIFPKICFPDKEIQEDEKVTFFVWEWIKGIFS